MPLYTRALARHLRFVGRRLPVVFLTGPRQSGKTTLARAAFPRYRYVSLEELDEREFAATDPRGFLARFESTPGVVLDEAQRAPEILSYLQGVVDRGGAPRFVLTGSQQFQLSRRIGQTLAGRSAVLSLYPLALGELLGRTPLDPSRIAAAGKAAPLPALSLDTLLWSGLYPRIHAEGVPPRDWLNGYVRTYVERDVREILNIGDLEMFSRFVTLAAGRTAQLLNLSALASDTGTSHVTVRRWISVLEAGGLVVLLKPHHRSLRRRLLKMPKLFFLDTGLACFLLGIRSVSDLAGHPLRGAIFESFVVSEVYKGFANRGEMPPLFFFRDRSGREVDLLIDLGRRVIPVEIKSSTTLRSEAFQGLDDYCRWAQEAGGVLIYGGTELHSRGRHRVRPWFCCS